MDTDPLPDICPLLGAIPFTSAIDFHSPTGLSWIAWIAIVTLALLCLAASAFVSGSEMAFFGLTPDEINELREQDENPTAKKILALLNRSEQLLATILIANNLVNISMVVLLTFAINTTVTISNTLLAFLLETVFLTLLLLLFGEILPKLLARGRTMQWVQSTATSVATLCRIFGPMANFMVKSSGIINRIVTRKQESISTDELEKALEISDVKEGKDKEMLEGILSFGEKEVSDIMISRVDVTSIEYHDSWQNALQTILNTGYSRIPVYDTTRDTIRGILYSKDVLPYIDRADENFRWQDLLRKPYFVPESRMIDDLLEDFRQRKMHIAIVIDEYGGTQGIVTLEDIIEEIVGEIDDEYDDTESMYKRIDDNTYIFEAKIPLGDFCRITGTDEDLLEPYAEDAETLAGLLLAIKGDFPTRKESIAFGNLRFLVMRMERHRIISVRVSILPLAQNQNETHGK